GTVARDGVLRHYFFTRAKSSRILGIFGSATEGQKQIEAGSFAFAGRTDDFHLTAKFAHPPRDNRQSQSGSARFGRKKRLENFILHRRRNSDAVVDDGDGQKAVAIRRAGDLHLAIAPITFDRL